MKTERQMLVDVQYVNALADLQPRFTIVKFTDGRSAMLLSRFELDGTEHMVAAVEGGLAEINLSTRENRFVLEPIRHSDKCWRCARLDLGAAGPIEGGF